jgi:ATP-binding cassette subfamily B protein
LDFWINLFTLQIRLTPVKLSGVQHSIEFENVSFKYPRSDEYALQNFSLKIPAGKTVAIVGPNGAGKSTFAKLLCRFYDPTEGGVKVDGVDVRDVDLERYRRRMTIMFQNPIRYMATAKRNIQMGDIDADLDQSRLQEAATGAKAQPIIKQLPDGYDTLLGKHFEGGVELSGGEWQRISLARAFYREAPIVVLDEPTSHMDSWAEADWLERFYTMVEEQTALIVTHRFTTAKPADIIHVMDEGKIVESGSHEDLLRQNGRYAASWRAQVEGGSASAPVDTSDTY